MQLGKLEASAWQQKWPAPAKINRFLHIVGRREDGYHLLQSVFQLVDFCDYLIFSPIDSAEIKLENSIAQVADGENLVIKAAKLLQQASSNTKGVAIHLQKNIPMGAGLGGGSSDAATTLLVLNRLWECALTLKELSTLGLKLGADVPFFLKGKNAFIEGIGEKITPLEIDLPKLLLAIPNCHIATAEVFSESHLPRNTSLIKLSEISTMDKSGICSILNLLDFGHNDCQQIVSEVYPEVKKTIHWLQSFSNPRLTGTGSCAFSTFYSNENIIEIATSPPNGVVTIMTKTLQTSPLHSLLSKY